MDLKIVVMRIKGILKRGSLEDSTPRQVPKEPKTKRVRLFCKRSRQVQDHSAYDKYEVQKTRALLLKFLSQNIADAIFSVRAKSM